MAIISSSLAFEGQAISREDAGRILKPDVRTINFKDKEHDKGMYLYILPGYKADSLGRGVWYRLLNVRADFGVSDKERFVEMPDSPVAYFANQANQRFPEYSKPQEIVNVKGQKQKVWPAHGRLTKRFLYNVAKVNKLHEGAHVIDVPSFGFADAIDKYHRKPLPHGGNPTLVNDHTQATPIFVWMNLDNNGQPWQVNPEPTAKQALPLELADSDYLYNLDDVFTIPNNEELYEKLRVLTPSDIFTTCMQGWGVSGAVQGASFPAPQRLQPPVQQSAPPMAGRISPLPPQAQDDGFTTQHLAPPQAPVQQIAKPMPIARPGVQNTSPALNNIGGDAQPAVERVQAPAASNPLAGGMPASVSSWLKPKV